MEDVEEDASLQYASKKIQFYLSEDTQLHEIEWSLTLLERDWEEVRRQIEEQRKKVETGDVGVGNRPWWKLWSS